MTDMETIWLVVAGVLGLAVILFVTYLVGSTARSRPKGGRHRAPHKDRPHRDTFRTEEPEPEPKKRAAVIVQDATTDVRSDVTAQLDAADWDEPLWLEATEGDAAAEAARTALASEVDVVCVLGDSVVRRGVVEVLAGTETPVAFLPRPNRSTTTATEATAEAAADVTTEPGDWTELAATHTALHGEELASAMATALAGQNSRIDVGRARLASLPPAIQSLEGAADGEEPAAADIVFLHSLVLGDLVPVDAPALSTRDVARGVFKGTSFVATVKPDDDEATVRPARSISFATEEIQPVTEEGEQTRALEVYLHASQTIKGWTGVAKAMMRKSSRATPLLIPLRSAAFTVTLDKPVEVTIDGRPVGVMQPGEAVVALDPLALVVRR